MTIRHEIIGEQRDRLGECPLWDVRDQSLYWIDSKARRVQRLAKGAYREWATPSDVGSIALTRRGRLVLSLEDGFHLMDLGSGATLRLAEIHHKGPTMRMNDGRTDRQGRFVVGSMVMHRRDLDGGFYRLEKNGDATALFDGIALANATCFSLDGRSLYHADSLSGAVSVADYDPVSGAVGPRHTLFSTEAQGSPPDGATVDAEGCLWIALPLSGKLGRYQPDGKLLLLLDSPVPYPTCPCFGGPELDVIYLTSISNSGNLLRSDHPDAGALVAFHGVGVRGLPEVLFDDEALG
ncbi:SMP-30/gluconolactonase/LRE family protein [Variovorax sp. PBL-E5]|uniref:SMP-30/gluconolactonase/LRE family protein n=1 Tax=Variovorax sp. PBL-E5 TaxID=434014 RepID=UPI001318C893|nr:SMP-30/gluconolactonase/LRE family protein [Variovorax sp. PBL-E5]VTU45228.1 L-arabinolactonase [Variovorax sp. PBL-E5]